MPTMSLVTWARLPQLARMLTNGRHASCRAVGSRPTARRGSPLLAARSICVGRLLPDHSRAFSANTEEKEPEYAAGDLSGYEVFSSDMPFLLQRGGELPELKIAYETWGTLNHRKDNAILLHCGMSASSHARSHAFNSDRGWWEDFIGPGKPLDTNLFYVICSNSLGGCFGSTGPSSVDPRTGKRYGSRFPRFEVHDQVAAQFLLLDHLGIGRLHASVGASLGGMQSLCAAANFPDRVGKCVTISACAKSFPGSIAFRHAQRQAVMGDANWNNGDYYDGELPADGLRLARQIGTITYRSGKEWQSRFGQKRTTKEVGGLENEFQIEHYLAHQGGKWVGNYDPNSLLFISKAMDGFTLEKPDADGNPSLAAGLASVQMPTLVLGVQTDVLFPIWQQKQISDTLKRVGNKRVVYYELDTIFGHDGFLLAQEAIGPAVKGHLEQEPSGAAHLWKDLAQSASLILQASGTRGNQTDTLRDIWRTLAAGADEVETAKLKQVLKMVMARTLSENQVDRIFAERLPQESVALADFLSIQQYLQSSDAVFDI